MSHSIPLVIYHANCLDGYGSAFSAQHFFGESECELFAASHGEDVPAHKDREVYLVDFSFSRPILKQMCEQASKVTIIDHHISAAKELEGLEAEHANLHLVFDMDHSGAVLGWMHFFPDHDVPELLLDVEDRDLWNWQRDGSAERTAAMMSYPYSYQQWRGWVDSADAAVKELLREGAAINRFRGQMIERYKKRAHIGEVAGYKVPIVNCPSEIASELVGLLSQGYPFAAGYMDKGEKRGWSLRSHGKDGADVSLIAASFGGGGHRNAAGFATKISRAEAPNAVENNGSA
jgi:uncharacterized protein